MGIRAQSFAYTRTIVWAYANDNKPAPNSQLPGTKLPERAGLCTTSGALSIKGRSKGQKEMQVVGETEMRVMVWKEIIKNYYNYVQKLEEIILILGLIFGNFCSFLSQIHMLAHFLKQEFLSQFHMLAHFLKQEFPSKTQAD